MCGIAGFLTPNGVAEREAASILSSMTGEIRHRGPDDQGQFIDASAGIALGHRRLAILELSNAGAQPMRSESGRYSLVYNGEIYNHHELRRSLPEPRGGWRGHSDTESLLAAIEYFGTVDALDHLVGMFAFALWDAQERSLFLARDRFGEKPLYYGWFGPASARTLLFGSELKALRRHPAFNADLDNAAIASLLHWGYIPAPQSIYRNVAKLTAGSWLRIDAAGAQQQERYWSSDDVIASGMAAPLTGSIEESADALEEVLGRAVRGQMISDVPLGALLSGGIDSSAITALMQRSSSVPVRTFSIGFEESRFDEAPQARAIARHLGTDHQERYVTGQDALNIVPQLPQVFDEPFADSSQIPTILLSRMVRQEVIVALSGDGGDELFAGYDSYRLFRRYLWVADRLGPAGRGVLARALPLAPAAVMRMASKSSERHSSAASQLDRVARMLRAPSALDAGREISARWVTPPLRKPAPPSPLSSEARLTGDPVADLMALDTRTYLADDILVKVDRAAMSTSLETRVPMLDHRVFEVAWRIPLDHRLASGETKAVLRRVLERHVPRELSDRPKSGFSVPIAAWLRGPLRAWASDMLAPDRLRREGLLDASAITRTLDEHLGGKANHQAKLWSVLMLQAWLEDQ